MAQSFPVMSVYSQSSTVSLTEMCVAVSVCILSQSPRDVNWNRTMVFSRAPSIYTNEWTDPTFHWRLVTEGRCHGEDLRNWRRVFYESLKAVTRNIEINRNWTQFHVENLYRALTLRRADYPKLLFKSIWAVGLSDPHSIFLGGGCIIQCHWILWEGSHWLQWMFNNALELYV